MNNDTVVRIVIAVIVVAVAGVPAVVAALRRSKPIKSKPIDMSAPEEQALIATLVLSSDNDIDRIYALEDKLAAAIERTSAGEFDGDEWGKGECILYMYGPDAEGLYSATIPILNEYRPAKGSYLVKRYGKPGAKQQRENL